MHLNKYSFTRADEEKPQPPDVADLDTHTEQAGKNENGHTRRSRKHSSNRPASRRSTPGHQRLAEEDGGLEMETEEGMESGVVAQPGREQSGGEAGKKQPRWCVPKVCVTATGCVFVTLLTAAALLLKAAAVSSFFSAPLQVIN